jgi:hypothetical protein
MSIEGPKGSNPYADIEDPKVVGAEDWDSLSKAILSLPFKTIPSRDGRISKAAQILFINEVREGKATLEKVTSSYGIRDAVERLLTKENQE